MRPFFGWWHSEFGCFYDIFCDILEQKRIRESPLKEAAQMSERSERSPSHRTDVVAAWISEANRDFFGRDEEREPISASMIRRSIIGFIVVALGVGLIVWQVLESA